MNSIDQRLQELQKLLAREKARPIKDASLFARFCRHQVGATKGRAKMMKIPHNLTFEDIDLLLVKQNYCCAVSGIPLTEPRKNRDPFAPSLDRIVPSLGYVVGNVRLVCTVVNYAMSNWGHDVLLKLVSEWKGNIGLKSKLREDRLVQRMRQKSLIVRDFYR